MLFNFQNTKHTLLPAANMFILGLIPILTEVSIYIIDEFHNAVIQQKSPDPSGLLLLESNWFASNSSRFEVFIVDSNNQLQTITSTLDSNQQADRLLYYRKKGSFYCKSASEKFETGQLPVSRVHSIFHAIQYN